MKKMSCIIGIILLAVVIALLIWNSLQKKMFQQAPFVEPVEIISLDHITLEIIGMRNTTVYEILPKDHEVEIAFYEILFRDGKDEKTLVKCVSYDLKALLLLLNECDFAGWNGFYGEHPKDVKDGEMFELTAIVNDGLEIKAEGSANFPDHFPEFRRTLNQILSE